MDSSFHSDEMCVMSAGHRFFRGLRHRVIASIGVFGAGSIGLILYFAFWASHYAWYQNLAVVTSFFVAIFAIIAGVWISWAMRAGFHE
jgi:ABC-type phosphate/phosphonate transport system permease subunit